MTITRYEYHSITPDMTSEPMETTCRPIAKFTAGRRGHRIIIEEEHIHRLIDRHVVKVGVLMTTYSNLDGKGWTSRDNQTPSQFSLKEILTICNS